MIYRIRCADILLDCIHRLVFGWNFLAVDGILHHLIPDLLQSVDVFLLGLAVAVLKSRYRLVYL